MGGQCGPVTVIPRPPRTQLFHFSHFFDEVGKAHTIILCFFVMISAEIWRIKFSNSRWGNIHFQKHGLPFFERNFFGKCMLPHLVFFENIINFLKYIYFGNSGSPVTLVPFFYACID